jgi:tRNA-specific 2-thiouridylase
MEVCFVPRGDTAAFVASRAPLDALRPGALVGDDGTVLGRHEGVHRFTVGQRRGLGVGGGPARYVRGIDASSGTVTVAERGALASTGLRARDVTWGAGGPPAPGTAVGVRIRHRHPLVAGRVTPCGAAGATVVFDGRGPLVTPGQAAVFYRDDVVVGGGWIDSELAA